MMPPITVKITKAVITDDLTSVSQDLEYEASIGMIKIQPLDTPDPGSQRHEHCAHQTRHSALQVRREYHSYKSLPRTPGLHQPGGGHTEHQEHDLPPVTQQTNVGVVPVVVDEVD